MRKTIRPLIAAAILLSAAVADAARVTALGRAKGAPEKSREEALAAALREAVRKGAGVDVLSESQTKNFQTEFDRVLTSSFGYVGEYEIIEQNYDADTGVYTVKVNADVVKGRPKMDQVLALRMLAKRMQSPRVEIVVKEKISGQGSGDDAIAANIIEEMAQRTGMQVVKRDAVTSRDNREASRAALLGDDFDAKVKKAGITSVCDFKIIAKISGRVGPMRQPFPGVNVRNTAISVDLQAIWPDTGQVVATYSMPTVYFKGESNMQLPYDMPEELVRHYLNGILTGSMKEFKKKNGYRLFQRIIAKWITELDLGAHIQLEIKKIDRKELDKLIAGLKKTPKVSCVWQREFDRRLYSVVEMETRLNTRQIEDAVNKLIGNKYVIDTATKHRLRLIPK